MKYLNNKKILLFTEEFPFGKTETFLETEISYLSEEFTNVIILPGRKLNDKRLLPDNVVVDDSYAEYLQGKPTGSKHYLWKGLLPAFDSNRPLYTNLFKNHSDTSIPQD
ncbi:MAG: hypothetical protein U5K72_14545 [Balneolaceae bacterium]|nr:hypothetical protein [Balneolaceae bacterium]